VKTPKRSTNRGVSQGIRSKGSNKCPTLRQVYALPFNQLLTVLNRLSHVLCNYKDTSTIILTKAQSIHYLAPCSNGPLSASPTLIYDTLVSTTLQTSPNIALSEPITEGQANRPSCQSTYTLS
jgi:hypothetical protein